MLLAKVLSRVVGEGQLTIIDAAGQPHRLVGPKPGPAVTMRVHDRRTEWRLLMRPRLAFGESYMDGTLTIEDGGDLYALLDLLGRNMAAFESTPFVKWSYRWQRVVRAFEQYNPIGKAQRNVAHHYDLKDELYDLFLDPDRQYSCAYFRSPDDSLEQAQTNKKRHIAAKLLLRPGMKVLDIGSGWGGLGLHLAETDGIDVTGVTLSTEQLALANERAVAAGNDLVTVAHSPMLADQARRAMALRAASDEVFRARLEQAAGRVRALRGQVARVSQELPVVLEKPSVTADSEPVFVRRGGTAVVQFTVGGGWSEAGVRVGRFVFPSWPGKGGATQTWTDVPADKLTVLKQK